MISFVVIGKNEGERLLLCLSSIHKVIEKYSSKMDFEITYVDSKSTDGSIERIKELYPDVHIFKITGDCNAAIGRNIGAAESHGDILCFLDGDMELDTDFLFETVLDENCKMKYPFCNGNITDVYYDNDWKFIKKFARINVSENSYRSKTGGFFVIEKKIWDSVGGMDDDFTKSQDNDLGIRLTNKGYPVLTYAKTAINHHTIPYFNRSLKSQISNIRYPMVIVRRNLFTKRFFDYSLRMYPMAFLLLFTIIALLFIKPWWLAIIPYLLMSIYRSIRKGFRTFFVQLFRGTIIDFTELYALFFFRLPKLERKYVRIN